MSAVILVADDDDDILLLVTTRLRRDGHEVVSASRGDDALALAREIRPALAVLDVGMPGLDGIEVLDHLRLAANHHAVPALQSPDATTRAHVHIVDALRRKFPGAPEIVNVIGIAAID